MTALEEDAAVEAVARAIRRLFSIVSEAQARDLARAVLRDLAREGFILAWRPPPAAE